MAIKKGNTPRAARAMPFAHFFGFSPRAESDLDDDRQRHDGESEEEYTRRMEALDEQEEEARRAEEEREREEEARRAEEQRREEEEARTRAEGNDVDGDDADAEEDEDDDAEATARAGRAQGARHRERARCAAILAEGIKLGRVHQACSFAFDTKLTASQAVSALKMASLDAPRRAAAPREPQSRRDQLYSRMESQPRRNPGAADPSAPTGDAAKDLAAKIVAAGERVAR